MGQTRRIEANDPWAKNPLARVAHDVLTNGQEHENKRCFGVFALLPTRVKDRGMGKSIILGRLLFLPKPPIREGLWAKWPRPLNIACPSLRGKKKEGWCPKIGPGEGRTPSRKSEARARGGPRANRAQRSGKQEYLFQLRGSAKALPPRHGGATIENKGRGGNGTWGGRDLTHGG